MQDPTFGVFGIVAALAALLVASPQPRAETPTHTEPAHAEGLPRLDLFDGRFTLLPTARLDLDAGSFAGQDVRPGFQSNVNIRRGRIGLEATLLRDIDIVFQWEFAPAAPGDQPLGGRLYELQMAYRGIEGTTLRAGAFTPLHTLDFSSSSFTLPFLERASISELAASIASGTSRIAAGAELRGETWFASAYATEGVAGTPNDDAQRGVAGRAALQPFDGILRAQIGINGAMQFHPGTRSDESVRLRDYPELRISPNRFLDTKSIPAGQAWAVGPELSGMVGPLHYAAEYQAIGVEADSGPARRFSGWYAAASWPLVGAPRRWDALRGSWAKPETARLDPAAGEWGWLELAGRYSRADLNDGPTRGGAQSIWTAALNWYPAEQVRVSMQVEVGQITGNGPDRPFQAVGWRLSVAP
ncbi:porin [Roseomonas sp. CAU 1739]|uniref:OprO/OprP family phosphate-selective porin n=1 Tax=Roseomonas sp. CAU 1739 TaxID=3140364 RepID=UPI00325C1B2D